MRRSYEERREDERRYQADVVYEVWRSGGDPDSVDRDRVHDAWDVGASPDEAAEHEVQRQRRPPIDDAGKEEA